ncbi:fumarylacetoacetate hydrolase family protein [Halobacillus naozhouensis]|uniref:Fumarylacetoacetate hydrolase family protein n=1 Tax=Halobacillus naozhouensis TaxID=554880 RepID=A0ABY8IVT8_9BACI|nr:fumarylacetoacetate hydrolase family protein [Halobacillus naozhouensis]WFT74110.1 fumarylacetoacetate hydrolase family protein [Halobacillus naozhouensis]
MRIIRYSNQENKPALAAVTDEDKIYDLPFEDFLEIVRQAEDKESTALQVVEEIISQSLPLEIPYDELSLLVPIEAQEVWASGVTFEKSRDERNYEATGGKLDAATFYDKVYDAERPEIFFKSTNKRTVGPEEDVYLRSDSNWQIPEPEVGLVLGNKGQILGFTIGNDMSCRDIEGENPLYLPQAKVWKNSCALGPAIRLSETVEDPYELEITCRIYRDQEKHFEGTASMKQLKRKFDELAAYLLKDNTVFDGTVLLTGTCIVPPNEFSLRDGDQIEIEVPGIGVLVNSVKSQVSQLVFDRE